MKISEYDAFGPWIYRIDEDHPIPRCFVSHIDDDDEPLFRLKVPKHIERRDATPDMDLYEYLLSVYEDRLELLHLADEGVWMKKVKYNKITAVSLYRDVLLGRLSVHMQDDTFTFDFNATSEEIVMEVISEVRRRYPGKSDKNNGGFDSSKINPEDLFFVNRWNQLKKEEGAFTNCAYQPPCLLEGDEDSGADKNKAANLGGSLHMQKEREWIILNRLAEYDYEYLFIPRTDSVSFAVGGDTPYQGIGKISITAGSLSRDILYRTDNSALAGFYH